MAFLAVILLPGLLASQIPCTMNYQGVLNDAEGNPVSDGDVTLTFNLYNVPAGGDALYEETHPAVSVSGGIFNVIIGSIDPLDLPFDEPYWLGITVGDEGTELSPRIELTAVAYSIIAKSVADGAAVKSFNGMTDDVTIEGGNNVSITEVDGSLIIEAMGISGPQGISCWDLNGNGMGDDNEDINGDGIFDALDCVGAMGVKGDPGLPEEDLDCHDKIWWDQRKWCWWWNEEWWADDGYGYDYYDGGIDRWWWDDEEHWLYFDREKNKPVFCRGQKSKLGEGPEPGIVGPMNNWKSVRKTAETKSIGVQRGNVAEFFNFFEDNEDPAVVISTEGTGPAAVAQVTNAENASPALLGFHTGIGSAVSGFTSGSGRAGEFVCTNTNNSQAGLISFHEGSGTAIDGRANGSGRAGSFTNRNEDNSEPALAVFHHGSGSAITGVANGTGNAAEFFGDVFISGNVSKGGGSFKIDHPLDPENKYLSHSFVESPDMMNVYNGNVRLNSKGEAVVDLPKYFDALNSDFRYQLTAIGAPGPNLYIAGEISQNNFKISGGESGMKVSWQVTGIRKDKYAETNRIRVEEIKSGDERGKYLHPKVYGKSKEEAIHYKVLTEDE